MHKAVKNLTITEDFKVMAVDQIADRGAKAPKLAPRSLACIRKSAVLGKIAQEILEGQEEKGEKSAHEEKKAETLVDFTSPFRAKIIFPSGLHAVIEDCKGRAVVRDGFHCPHAKGDYKTTETGVTLFYCEREGCDSRSTFHVFRNLCHG